MFDFPTIMKNAQMKGILSAGKSVNVSLSLVNFTSNKGESKDFRVNYAFSFNYYD